MSRFFFHVHDGRSLMDDLGAEFGSLADARQFAARYASDLIRDQPDLFWSEEEWKIDIADIDGLVFSTLIILGIDSPAGGSRSRIEL